MKLNLKVICLVISLNGLLVFVWGQEGDPFIDSLLIEAEHEEKKSRLARIYNDIGFHYHSEYSELDEAEYYARKGLSIGIKNNLAKACADAYNVLGLSAYSRLENKLALVYYDSANYYFKEVQDTSGLVAVYNNIGRVYTSLGNCEMAMEGFLTGVRLVESQNKKFKLLSLKINYAIGLFDCFQYNDAIQLAEETLPLAYEVGPPGYSSHLNYVIGSSHLYLGNHEKALSILQEVADTLKAEGDELNYGNVLGSIGDVYLKMNQYERAYDVITKSIAITRKFDPKINETSLQMSLGMSLIGRGEINKGMDYLEAGIELAEEKEDLNYLPDAYFELAQVYDQQGRFEQAFEAMEQSKTLGDSLRHLQVQGRIRELNKQYEYEKVSRALKETQLKTQVEK